MSAAFAVVGGLVVKPAVVLVKNEMLAFITNHIGYAPEIFRMFGDDKSAGLVSQNHSRRVNKTALVINA